MTRLHPISIIMRSIMRAQDRATCLFRATFEPSKTGDYSIKLKRVPYFVYHFNKVVAANRSSLLIFSFNLRPQIGTVRFALCATKRHFIDRDFFLGRRSVSLSLSSLALSVDFSLLVSSSLSSLQGSKVRLSFILELEPLFFLEGFFSSRSVR